MVITMSTYFLVTHFARITRSVYTIKVKAVTKTSLFTFKQVAFTQRPHAKQTITKTKQTNLVSTSTGWGGSGWRFRRWRDGCFVKVIQCTCGKSETVWYWLVCGGGCGCGGGGGGPHRCKQVYSWRDFVLKLGIPALPVSVRPYQWTCTTI